jgi:hypothetical protein
VFKCKLLTKSLFTNDVSIMEDETEETKPQQQEEIIKKLMKL